MDRSYIIIDDKYLIEVTTATELLDGILSSVLTVADSFDGGVLANLLADEIEAAEGERPQIQQNDSRVTYYPYRVVEIDTTTQTVFDEGEIRDFRDYV